jgi:hypothetical protein
MKYQYEVVLSALANVSQSQFIYSETELSNAELEEIAKSKEGDNIWNYHGLDDSSNIEVVSSELWLTYD